MTTLREMRAVAEGESERIMGTQKRLIDNKHRAEPDPGEVARAQAFAAMVRLIDLIYTDDVMLERTLLLMRRASRG